MPAAPLHATASKAHVAAMRALESVLASTLQGLGATRVLQHFGSFKDACKRLGLVPDRPLISQRPTLARRRETRNHPFRVMRASCREQLPVEEARATQRKPPSGRHEAASLDETAPACGAVLRDSTYPTTGLILAAGRAYP